MSDKIFIDTNILVYSLDDFDSTKKEQARKLLRQITENHNGVISTQVLQEFYVATTKKLHCDPVIVKGIINQIANFEVVSITPELVTKAVDCSILNRISYWDALIVSAAQIGDCRFLLTEDLQEDQEFGTVQILNPFHNSPETLRARPKKNITDSGDESRNALLV